MKLIDNEQVFAFDIDKTLISARRAHKAKDDIGILNPYTKEIVYCKPHIGHIDLLKEMFGRGRFIIVWSAAGVQWAKAVVEALGVSEFADVIMTKPIGYVDDKKVEEWMSNRIFLDEDERT